MAGKGVVLIVLLVLVVGGFLVFRGDDSDSGVSDVGSGSGSSAGDTSSAVPAVQGDESVDETIVGSDGTDEDEPSDDVASVKRFSVIAKRWDFSPSTIEVDEGDTVIMNIESVDVSHGFVISAFGVSEFLSPGNTVSIEFVADKAGSFPFFCNVQCGSGHGSMRGTLIVN